MNITVSPSSGAAGATVTVSGGGFGRNQNLRLYSGNVILAAVVCDEHGTFSVPVKIPTKASGNFIIRVATATPTAAKYVVATPPPPPASTVKLVEWAGWQVYGYTDAQLQQCADLGIGGFAVSVWWLNNAQPASMIPADFASRCRAHGITKLYYVITPGDYGHDIVPFGGDWFDDTMWDAWTVPTLTRIATELKQRGFDGIAFDDEGYPGSTGKPFTWDWDYPGRTRTEAEVRAQVTKRGGQVGAALTAGFPGIEIASYHDYFDASWNSSVLQPTVNKADPHAISKETIVTEFWDGLAHTPGRGPITFMDATFYFCPVLTGWSNDQAMGKNATDLGAFFAAKGWTDTYVTPFLWMGPTNGDGSSWTQNHSMQPDAAYDAAQAAKRHAQNGIVVNYCYEGDVFKLPYADFTSTNGHITHGDFRPAYGVFK